MKKSLLFGGLVLFMSMSLFGCGGGGNTPEPTPKDPDTPQEEEPKDETDYGKVTFDTIFIYADASGHNFDEVLVRPHFTKPEVCQNEVFEYDIKDESICYIEDNYVYATGMNGSTRVTATSQHLKGTFMVYCQGKYANDYAFSTAKSLANTAKKATNQGTTLFVGDSFFEFWRNKTNVTESFAEAFNGYDVANVGISGTQAREWRSLRKTLIDPYEPENIVLNIGINDVDDNNEDGEGTAEYIMFLCNDIWDKHPDCHIYYCSITRCAGYFAGKWTYHSESNELMKANAQNNDKLHYLDIMERYGDNYASYEQSDGLHPNSSGYEIFKDVIKTNVPLKTK